MGWWERRVVPRLVDVTLRGPEIERRRAEVTRGLHGRVLEIGFGSGRNLPHLPAEVSALDVVEPSDRAWAMSEARRAAAGPLAVRRVGLDGQRVDAAPASYDAVLVTFSLCTIPDAPAALAEVVRLLRPGAALHFLEHGLAPDPGVVRWQHRLEPLQRRLAGGCHLTRDVPALVEGAGLRLGEVQAGYLPGPAVNRPLGYGFLGTATRAGG